MGDTLDTVLADLERETAELDALVADLDDEGWARATPAEGWTVADQIGHLAWTDDIATVAATDPAAFGARLGALAEHGMDAIDTVAHEWGADPDQLGRWRAGRQRLWTALRAVPAGTRVVWFGPPMSPTSMATARLMETWAHGQDVADALGVERLPTDRLRHVAHIGVRTRDFAYLIRDLTPPAEPFRVDLVGPGGQTWSWGPEDAAQRVSGPAQHFALLVTQRRHRAELDVRAEGADADRWLDIAQAFAGPPGPGRAPGTIG